MILERSLIWSVHYPPDTDNTNDAPKVSANCQKEYDDYISFWSAVVGVWLPCLLETSCPSGDWFDMRNIFGRRLVIFTVAAENTCFLVFFTYASRVRFGLRWKIGTKKRRSQYWPRRFISTRLFMRAITKWYLKWYYGYKNFGDELLGLGVIVYLFEHYPLQKLYIEVDNVDWFSTRLKRHEFYLGENIIFRIQIVNKYNRFTIIRHSILDPTVHVFLGGWEVFAPARGRFFGGWNMFILYFASFFLHRVTLLWGISKPTSLLFKALYRLTIPFARSVILRDKGSYETVVETYRKPTKTTLYHDFAFDVVQEMIPLIECVTGQETTATSSPLDKTLSWKVSIGDHIVSKKTDHTNNSMSTICPDGPYIIVNANPYIDKATLIERLQMFFQNNSIATCVYVPLWEEDKPILEELSTAFDSIKWTCFDWTQYDITAMLMLCKNASYGFGVRLHFLSMLVRLWVHFDYLVYQEKIVKFLENRDYYNLQSSLKIE